MKDRQYWIDRGSEGIKREGFVCVGEGDAGKGLISQLRVGSGDLWSERRNRNWGNNYVGTTDDIFYYLKEEKFNELFPATEVTMEDATEVKDRDYWIKRGSEFPQFEGVVCVGMRGEETLQKELGLNESILAHSSYSGETPRNFHYRGQDLETPYYLKSEDFDKLFPKTMKYLIKITSPEHSKAVQSRLFELGVKWAANGDEFRTHNIYNIFVKDRTIYTDVSRPEFYEEITLNDLYTRDLFPKPKPIGVKLNGSYTAEVHHDKIVLGCQTFSMEVFEELRAAVDKIKA